MNKIKQIGAFLLVVAIVWGIGELIQSFTNPWDWWVWIVYIVIFIIVLFLSLLAFVAWAFRKIPIETEDDYESYLR